MRKLQISSSDARLPPGAGAVTPDSILTSTFPTAHPWRGFFCFGNPGREFVSGIKEIGNPNIGKRARSVLAR
jgi:hypothetical protein